MGHQGLELLLIDAADRRFVGNLGQRMAHPDDRDCLGQCLVFDDLHAVDMAPRALGLAVRNSRDFRSGMAFQRNPSLDQASCVFS